MVHLKGHVNSGSPRSRHQEWANKLLPADAEWHECILETGLDEQESDRGECPRRTTRCQTSRRRQRKP